jgi:hypothetical protein
MSQYGDEDLRDVFRLLYDGEDEDWAAFDEVCTLTNYEERRLMK